MRHSKAALLASLAFAAACAEMFSVPVASVELGAYGYVLEQTGGTYWVPVAARSAGREKLTGRTTRAVSADSTVVKVQLVSSDGLTITGVRAGRTTVQVSVDQASAQLFVTVVGGASDALTFDLSGIPDSIANITVCKGARNPWDLTVTGARAGATIDFVSVPEIRQEYGRIFNSGVSNSAGTLSVPYVIADSGRTWIAAVPRLASGLPDYLRGAKIAVATRDWTGWISPEACP